MARISVQSALVTKQPAVLSARRCLDRRLRHRSRWSVAHGTMRWMSPNRSHVLPHGGVDGHRAVRDDANALILHLRVSPMKQDSSLQVAPRGRLVFPWRQRPVWLRSQWGPGSRAWRVPALPAVVAPCSLAAACSDAALRRAGCLARGAARVAVVGDHCRFAGDRGRDRAIHVPRHDERRGILRDAVVRCRNWTCHCVAQQALARTRSFRLRPVCETSSSCVRRALALRELVVPLAAQVPHALELGWPARCR